MRRRRGPTARTVLLVGEAGREAAHAAARGGGACARRHRPVRAVREDPGGVRGDDGGRARGGVPGGAGIGGGKKNAGEAAGIQWYETHYWKEAREAARMRYEEALRREAAAEPPRDCACDICGTPMESRGFEEIGVVTQMGEVTLGRRYYTCPTVGHGGYAPFDRLLGLHNHTSKGMQDWICYTAAKEAFAGAAETVAVFSGVALGHATVQEVAEWHGQQVDAAQKALVERVFDPATRPAEPRCRILCTSNPTARMCPGVARTYGTKAASASSSP